jgi:hypothetical protein
MKLAYSLRLPSRVLAACCVLALSGCAADKTLNNQLATSREAVDQAKIAGAAETAPADLDTAVDKLNRADTAAKERDGRKAMFLAEQAQVDANLARAKTDSAHATMAAAELEKSNQILRETYRAHQNQ